MHLIGSFLSTTFVRLHVANGPVESLTMSNVLELACRYLAQLLADAARAVHGVGNRQRGPLTTATPAAHEPST